MSDSIPLEEKQTKIQMTRRQRNGGMVVIAGIALFAILSLANYSRFLVYGADIPDEKQLARIQGTLVLAKRYGGKTKRQNLELKIEGEPRIFIFSPRAGNVDEVEAQLDKAQGALFLVYDPENDDIFEIRRGQTVIRSYDETTREYRASFAIQAHLRGILALGLLVSAIALMIGLLRRPLQEGSVEDDNALQGKPRSV